MNRFEEALLKETPKKSFQISGHPVRIISVDLMRQAGSFGHHVDGVIFVRENLPKAVERFVIEHEIYHLKDARRWWGWIGRELRVNFVCASKNPVGFIAAVCQSLKRDRIGAYWRALKMINFK